MVELGFQKKRGPRRNSQELRESLLEEGNRTTTLDGANWRPSTPAMADSMDLALTFSVMEHRKLIRKVRGTYKKPYTFLIRFICYAAALAVFFQNSQWKWTDNSNSKNIFNTLKYSTVALVCTLAMVLIFVIPPDFWVIDVIVFWLFAFGLLAIVDPSNDIISIDSKIYIFAGVITITLLWHIGYNIIFFWCLDHCAPWNIFNPTLHQDPMRPNRYHYRSSLFWRYYVEYTGSLRDGRPHGHGEWYDSDPQGEMMKCYFIDGVPLGPFDSFCSKNGNGFSKILIGLVTNRRSNGSGKVSRFGIEAGVASVECSVSGEFYKNLPRVQWFDPVQPCPEHQKNSSNGEMVTLKDCTCVKEILPNMRHLEENEEKVEYLMVNLREFPDNDSQVRFGLGISGHSAHSTGIPDKAVISVVDDSMSGPQLRVNGWELTSNVGFEAIVFIHGFNCPYDFAMKKLGSFLSLAHLPAYIKPFVFSWPTAESYSPTNYLTSLELAEDSSTTQAFVSMTQSLINAGFKRVTFLGHSCGATVVMEGMRAIRPMLEAGEMQIDKIIFLNPDYPVTDFVDGGFAMLYRYCKTITMYVDSRDKALKMATLGCRIVKCNKGRRSDIRLGSWYHPLSYTDGGANRRYSRSDAHYLDIDIIDTTNLKVNTDYWAHGNFCVNRLMVDDLRDLIVHGTRASHRRSRLMRMEGNKFVFVNTPTFYFI